MVHQFNSEATITGDKLRFKQKKTRLHIQKKIYWFRKET